MISQAVNGLFNGKNSQNVFTANELHKHFKVLEVQPYCLKWILDSNGIFLSKVYLLEGDPAAGKSQFGYEMGQMFLDIGGLFILVESENKTSQMTLTAKLGPDRMNSGRFLYTQTYSVDGKNSWQEAVSEWVKTLKKPENGLDDMPTFILVDSMTGVAGASTAAEYEENGVMQARSYDGAATANSISKFFKQITGELSGTNITLAFTNHLKDGIASQADKFKKAAGGGKKGVGGVQPRYNACTTLWFTRGGKGEYASATRREIHIAVFKNSFGSDVRRMTVPFYVTLETDPDTGEVVVDGDENPVRKITWDWDEATTALLHRFCAASSASKTKEAKKAARDVLHLDMKNASSYSSKTLGVEGVTPKEMGKLINENEALYKQLIKVQPLSVQNYPNIVKHCDGS